MNARGAPLLIALAVAGCAKKDPPAPATTAAVPPPIDAAVPVDAALATDAAPAIDAAVSMDAAFAEAEPSHRQRLEELRRELATVETTGPRTMLGTRGPVLGTGAANGDLGGLSAGEIDRVVRSRAGLLRACYQQQLEKDPALAGRVVVTFTIAADGAVPIAAIDAGASTLADPNVRACVARQFQRLRFPAKGHATVTYPLVFGPGK